MRATAASGQRITGSSQISGSYRAGAAPAPEHRTGRVTPSVELRRHTRSPDVSAGCCGAQAWAVARAGRPTVRASAVAGRTTDAVPLVGRREALRAFEDALDASREGSFRFLSLVGEPGAGKTRLLGELAALAAARDLATLWGRAAEFEQEMPFGVVVNALDDHVEASLPGLALRLGAETSGLLATVLPSPAGGRARPGRASFRPRQRSDRPLPPVPRDAAAAGGTGRSARAGTDPR